MDLKKHGIYIHIYTHTTKYYSAMRKKENIPFATPRTELEDIMLSEISQTVKEKYSVISLESQKAYLIETE